MQLHFNVNQTTISPQELPLSPITVGLTDVQCTFVFSSDWQEYDKEIFFRNSYNKEEYKLSLPTTGNCLLPVEVLGGRGVLYVGVLGKKNGSQLYPTIWSKGILVVKGVPIEGKIPLPPRQYEVVPSPIADREGEIFQYTGVVVDGFYTGFFYRCEQVDDMYGWVQVNTQVNSVFVHPDTHDASMIVEDTQRRFVCDDEKKQWQKAFGHSIVTGGNPHGVTTNEISAVAQGDKISNQDIYDIINHN